MGWVPVDTEINHNQSCSLTNRRPNTTMTIDTGNGTVEKKEGTYAMPVLNYTTPRLTKWAC